MLEAKKSAPQAREPKGTSSDDATIPLDPSTNEPVSLSLSKGGSADRSGERSSVTPTPATLIGSGPGEARSVPGVLAPGSQFGVYMVGSCIGEGGMARIYQAEHAGLRRQVALKVLIDGFAKDPDGRERFVREARIAAAIKHPNVVNIFDVGVYEDVPYLVMELLEGKDLEKLLESKRPLDESLIIDIMVPVVAGLIAVHDAGVVHRDLKPGNIFLAQGRYNDLEPKLLDFGISKAAGPEQFRLTANRTFMGTPFYVAPEGLGGGEMTPLSDQYSLGVLMYECATGFTPFTASTFAELSALITSGQYTPPGVRNPELSRRLARIIERAMNRYPEQRFKNMRELGRELLFLAGQRTRVTWGLSFGELKPTPTSNTSEYVAGRSSPPQPEARLRRNPRTLALAIAPLLLLSVALVFWLSGRGSVVQSGPGQPLAAPGPVFARPETGPEPATAPGHTAASDTTGRSPLAAVGGAAGRPEADHEAASVTGLDGKSVAQGRDTRATRGPSDQVSNRRTARPPGAVAAQPGKRPMNTSMDEPEWALPPAAQSQGAPKSGDLWLGPNGAPIFD
jgi:serine/threonine protein kinase